MADSKEQNEASSSTPSSSSSSSSSSKQGKLVLQAPYHDSVTQKDQLISLEVN